MIRFCAHCGVLFNDTTGQPRRRFCSLRCRWRAKNRRREGAIAAHARAAARQATRASRLLGAASPLAQRTCDVCGAAFLARSSSSAKRCSPACRREWARHEQHRLCQRPDDPRRSYYAARIAAAGGSR